MFGFVGCDVGNCGEDIGGVSSGTFYAVPVIDTASASLRIAIKVLKIIVEVNGASTEISTKEGGVSREDSGDIYSSLLGKR